MNRGRRWAVVTAAAGTVFIAAGAFWLSFTALADLAARSGIGAGQAWAWPLIVDGIIVVATVAVVALAGDRAAWYPWALLIGGALVSVTANALHAVVAADVSVPGILAAAVAAVPPVVLLAITHLTVVLTRTTPSPVEATPPAAPDDAPEVEPLPEMRTPILPAVPVTEPAASAPPATEPGKPPSPDTDLSPATATTAPPAAPESEAESPSPSQSVSVSSSERRGEALELRTEGLSNKQIARRLGVHPSTVGRWFAHLPDTTDPSAFDSEGVSS